MNNPLFSIPTKSTGNDIGDTGATSLSDALKTNTTLMKLDIGCKNKRNELRPSTIHFFPLSIIQQTTRLEIQVQSH